MKKIVLSAVVVAAMFTAKGQDAELFDFEPGIYGNDEGPAIFDDFATEEEYGDENLGIYWWSEEEPDPESESPNHTATITRNPDGNGGLGSLDVVLTQGPDEFGPFGFVFGGGIADEENGENGEASDPVTLNFLDKDFTYSMSVTNNSDSTLVFRMSPRDINEKLLDTDSSWNSEPLADVYQYAIEVVVPPGETDTLQAGVAFDAGWTTYGPLSGTYEGALFADYTDDDPDNCDPESRETEFDYTQVVGFNITVINLSDTGDDEDCREAYLRRPIEDLEVSINWVKIGEASPSTNIFSKKEESTFNIYPNPTQGGVVQLSDEDGSALTNVSVFDAQGNMVKSADRMESLNTDGFHSGFYIIKSDQGRQRLIVK